MMVTISRVVKYGLQAFLRNGWLSVSTISIMILAAVVFEGLLIFNVVGKSAIGSIQEKIDISVYFKSNVAEDTILSVKKSLDGLSEVAVVEYISREKALEEFKARHADEETVTSALNELDENPLLASLNIKAQDPSDYSSIASYLEGQSLKDKIEKVTYAQNKVVIDRLINLVETLKNSGITLTIFLTFLALMVTFNTIRLAIFSNSDQIGIMRLVGASNKFIQGPYIIEGILYGLTAAVISFVALVPIINFLSPYIFNLIPELNLNQYFKDSFFTLFFYQLLFCAGTGIISSLIAIRRYIRL